MSSPRFTTGSTMRHVAVMTATGAVGLMALFLVDVANLFYISMLGQTELAAAIGYAGTLQFFVISVSIGLAIASAATVSRAIGGGRRAEARRLASSALVVLLVVLSCVAVGLWIWRDAALGAIGATGEARVLAGRYLAIVVPTMPLLGVAMVTSGLLRAEGAATRAMWVTLSGGIVGAAVDPLLIFGFGLGLDGAALAAVISRLVAAGTGFWWAVHRHDLVARPSLAAAIRDARVLLAIALPAVATQLSTPFGNAFLTRHVAEFGDEAVAGWAVVGRISALTFGGIFALSGAIGPILGQNLGAGLPERIASAWRDALVFAGGYVLVAWAVLAATQGLVIRGFGLTGGGAEVYGAFASWGAGAFLFTAWLFVSNASFNNLGRPLWSTGLNWTRDAAVIPLLALGFATAAGPAGTVAIQALAGLLIGIAAVLASRHWVRRLNRPGAHLDPGLPLVVVPAFASGRAAAAEATLETAETPEPLAKPGGAR